MEEQLRTLSEMQKLDDKIGRYKLLQEELPKQLNEIIERVEKASIELNAAQMEKAELKKQQSSLEIDIQKAKDDIHKYSGQLATIKTNKEYKALNSEIAYLNEKISGIESQLLEMMDSENEMNAKLEILKKAEEEAKAEQAAKEGDLKTQIAALEGQIEETRAQRNKLASTLPTSLVKRYGSMIKNKNNIAVVYNRKGSCSGCGFVIRQQMRIELQLKKNIVYCENCGRILLD